MVSYTHTGSSEENVLLSDFDHGCHNSSVFGPFPPWLSEDGNKVLIKEGSTSVDIVDEVKTARREAADAAAEAESQRRSNEDNAKCDQTLAS